jgi:hypothetical protein
MANGSTNISKLFIVLYFFDSLLHDEDDFPGVDAAGANQFALSTEHTFVDVLCDFIYFAPHEEDIQPADVVEVGKVGCTASSGARPARNTQLVRWLVLPNVHGKPPVVPVEIDLAVFIYSVSPVRRYLVSFHKHPVPGIA